MRSIVFAPVSAFGGQWVFYKNGTHYLIAPVWRTGGMWVRKVIVRRGCSSAPGLIGMFIGSVRLGILFHPSPFPRGFLHYASLDPAVILEECSSLLGGERNVSASNSMTR